MKFIELFAGIGGFRLGLERAGHDCVWANEIDPYAAGVYRKNRPDGTLYEGDIRWVDPATLPAYDLLCAGFPCQPVSLAGKRKARADDRWLWPEINRVLRATRPRWVLLENVPGLLSADDGSAFAEVLRDLAASGFDVEWDCLPAAAFGAPHLRYRVFIVGHAASGGRPRESRRRTGTKSSNRHLEVEKIPLADTVRGQQRRHERQTKAQSHALADANRQRRQERRRTQPMGKKQLRLERGGQKVADAAGLGWSEGRSESTGFFGQTRIERSGWWSTEPDVGRVAYGVPARVDRLKCLGNAVVPQIIEWLGRRLKEAEESLNGREIH